MLHQLKFKNFYTFADEVVVSFVLGSHSPEGNYSFVSKSGHRLNKLLAVIGPNASGKTTVLKALTFLKWFVADSFASQKPDDDIVVEGHFFSDNTNTSFEVIFDYQTKIYRYELTLNRKRVITESLYIKTSSYFSYVFKREWNEKNKDYVFSQKNFGFSKREAAKVRPNASIISTASQYEVFIAGEIQDACNAIFSNVGVYGGLNGMAAVHQALDAAEVFKRNPTLERQAASILCKMDLGLQDIFIKPETIVESTSQKTFEISVPHGLHRKGKVEKQLQLWKESSGTLKAYLLLSIMLPALEIGGLIVVDELESDLHPDMLFPLLDLFISPETNPHNAQVIFSTHSHSVLDMLNKDQVLLVEKNTETGLSEAWLLGDMEGVRRDDNLYAKYRAGAYGAVPNL